MPFAKGNKLGKGMRNNLGRKAEVARLAERFAHEYVVDMNGAAAAKRAGYSAKTSTLSSIASRLLNRPDVVAVITALKAKQFKRLDMKADDVLQEIMRLADVDPGLLFDQDGELIPIYKLPVEVRRCISAVEYDAFGRPKVKFWSKVDALVLLAKHFKVCVERVEVKDVTDRAQALARARARAMSAVAPRLASSADLESPAPG